jgi:Reverse transcriptase (RNA-dependent DNA polymerase)
LDCYPLPLFEEIAAMLSNCKYFSVIDLKDPYLHLPVAEQSPKYFVIVTHKGHFSYTRLPFGVNFAPTFFQAIMGKILPGIQSTAAYIDDIINGANTTDAQLSTLRFVFNYLRKAGIRAQLSTCQFMQSSKMYGTSDTELMRKGCTPRTSV